MNEQVQQTVDKVETGAGISFGTAGITSPLWFEGLEPYMQIVTFILGSLVLLTTLYINIQKIRRNSKK